MNLLRNKALIVIIIAGLLASIPLISERIGWEKSSDQVELVMDYDDLMILSQNTDHPQQTEMEFLDSIKGSVNSIALYESTLERLKVRGPYEGKLWVYSGKELLDPVSAKNIHPEQSINPNHTYILFVDQETENLWAPQIIQFLSPEGEIRSIEWDGLKGLEIESPYTFIKQSSLGLDPVLAKKIKGQGFDIVPRLSNSYKDKERTLALIEQTAQYNPTHIIFQGEEAVGFPTYLMDVASLMNQYQIGLGMIELVKEQAGVNSLAYHLAHYNDQDKNSNDWFITRVHSLTETVMKSKVQFFPSDRIGEDPTVNSIDLQEQAELAVTERNIRMIYFHAAMPNAHVSLPYLDMFTLKESPDRILTKTAIGIEDVADRLRAEGFTLGQAGAFQYQEKEWMGMARWLVLAGGIAVISLLAAAYLPLLQWPIFFLGLFGVGLAILLGLEPLYFKFISLGTAVSVPVLAMKYAIEHNRHGQNPLSFRHILKVYFLTSLISFFGAWLVAGMLSHVKYSLYMDQFRGVSVLYLLPILLTLLWIVTSERMSILQWLKGDFKNYYLLILGVLGVTVLYYLSRSGNEASISILEVKFRSLLQTYLDIRPRTKEILLAHPLFILGLYLTYYDRRAVYLFVAAVIGQLSIVSTFTHLHTPFMVSVIRTGIGLGFGLIIGLFLIIFWHIGKSAWINIIRRLIS